MNNMQGSLSEKCCSKTAPTEVDEKWGYIHL